MHVARPKLLHDLREQAKLEVAPVDRRRHTVPAAGAGDQFPPLVGHEGKVDQRHRLAGSRVGPALPPVPPPGGRSGWRRCREGKVMACSTALSWDVATEGKALEEAQEGSPLPTIERRQERQMLLPATAAWASHWARMEWHPAPAVPRTASKRPPCCLAAAGDHGVAQQRDQGIGPFHLLGLVAERRSAARLCIRCIWRMNISAASSSEREI